MSIVTGSLKLILRIFFQVMFFFLGKPDVPKFMRNALDLYRKGEFSELFQVIRIWDAPYEKLDSIIPSKGNIIDLGCGDGLLANSLALSRKQAKVWGVDINKERISEAQKGVKNATFLADDITKKNIPHANVIILSHVLHHLPSKQAQEELLKKCATKLKKDGKLIILEIDNKPFFKYVLTWCIDAFVVPILFEHSLWNFNFFYRTQKEWITLFKSIGLQTKVTESHANKPFSHILFVGTKVNIKSSR